MRPESFCGTAYVLWLLSGRWKFQIVHWLLQSPYRFNELQKQLGEISHRTLSLQLKQLIEDGLVERRDFETSPPHVEYRLSARGDSLRPVLCAMHEWGAAHAGDGAAEAPEGEEALVD